VKSIYVGNLNYGSTEESIRSIFESHGTVDTVSLVTDRDSGRSRGFAFVEMPDEDDADKAIGALHGSSLDGRELNISEARPRRN
jgi:RNA recognition motif-containing protein